MATQPSTEKRAQASKGKAADAEMESPAAVRAIVSQEYIAFLRTLHMDNEPDPAIRAAVLKPLLFAHRQDEADGVPVRNLGGPRTTNQAARRRGAANAAIAAQNALGRPSVGSGSRSTGMQSSVAAGFVVDDSLPPRDSGGENAEIRSRLTLPTFLAPASTSAASNARDRPTAAPKPPAATAAKWQPSAFAVVTTHVTAEYPPTPQRDVPYMLPPAVADAHKRDAAARGVQPPAFVLQGGVFNPRASGNGNGNGAKGRNGIAGPPSRITGMGTPSTASGPLSRHGQLGYPFPVDMASMGSTNTLAQHLPGGPGTESASRLPRNVFDASTDVSQSSGVSRAARHHLGRQVGPRWVTEDATTIAADITDMRPDASGTFDTDSTSGANASSQALPGAIDTTPRAQRRATTASGRGRDIAEANATKPQGLVPEVEAPAPAPAPAAEQATPGNPESPGRAKKKASSGKKCVIM